MLINSAEILSLLTLDAEAVLKGAAFLVPIGSLLITIMCGYESFVRNKKLIKTTLDLRSFFGETASYNHIHLMGDA